MDLRLISDVMRIKRSYMGIEGCMGFSGIMVVFKGLRGYMHMFLRGYMHIIVYGF